MFFNFLILFAISIISYIIYEAFLSRLSVYPGPFLAKCTNLWRFLDVRKARHHETLRQLHKRHGPIVRIGPNLLSLSKPEWIQSIYSTKGEFRKTKAYSVNDIKLPDGSVVPTTFSVSDNQVHAEMVKPIQKLYNLNNVLGYEAKIDEMVELFITTASKVARTHPVDIGRQLQYLAYDVMSNITLGAPTGYLEQQADFQGEIRAADAVWDYFAPISQLPWLDRWLAKSNVSWISTRFPSFRSTMHRRCVELTTARIADKRDKGGDFLEDFIDIGGGREQPDFPILIAWLSSNVVAGSDTVAIQLKAAVYYILKNPRVHEKLQAEIATASLARPASYRQAKDHLPYLDAIIKESMRLHPAVGLLLEREVPASGFQLPNGPYLKGGTHVGMDAWVVHLDQVFGPDTESFVPERWLQGDREDSKAYASRLRRMHNADLTFGAGRRICSGKFVGLVEVYKILATLFAAFDMELIDREREWEVRNSWFVRQGAIEVDIRPREKV